MKSDFVPEAGPTKHLYVASRSDHLDFAGKYDLAAGLRSPTTVLVGTIDSPLVCSTEATSTLVAHGVVLTRSASWWPFGLYAVETDEYAVDGLRAYHCASCRVLAQEDASLMFGPCGEAVVAFINRLGDFDAVVERLAAYGRKNLPATLIPFALSHHELQRMASKASRRNLPRLELMFGVPDVTFSLPAMLLRRPRFQRPAARLLATGELGRAICITGLRDLLSDYDTDSYFVELQARTGVAMP